MKTLFQPGRFALSSLVLALVCTTLNAAEKDSPISSAEAFKRIKAMAGEWKGTAGPDGKGDGAVVSYRVASAGSIVVETFFPNTKHEMMSVYHLDGNNLLMTHYCAAGNQPRMKLSRKSTADHLVFDFDGGTNFKPKKDGHMHSLRLTFADANALHSEWDFYQDGVQKSTEKFELTRVDAAK